jgi:hypothetical protein
VSNEQIEDVDNDEDDNEQLIVPADSKISFLQDPKKNALYKLQKGLDKEVGNALKVLGEIMNDPSADTKLRVDAAKTILDKKITVSESISKDTLNRLLFEAKQNQASFGGNKMKNIRNNGDAEDVPAMPQFIPNVVMDLGNVSGV